MSRIAEKFAELKRENRRGFIPFITSGDPDLSTSLSILETLANNGADVIELGVPFSDPMADGPSIQRSSQRALLNGTTLEDVLNLASDFRKISDIPLVLFSYFNPIHRMGIENFANSAREAQVDGVLLTDVIEKEAIETSGIFARFGIDLISLIAPTTTDSRLETICKNARGFIYAVSRAGVTGARSEMSSDAEKLVARTRKFTGLPIAVGFGISTADQVKDVWRYADATVIGSAIVTEIERAQSPDMAIENVAKFLKHVLPEKAAIR